MANAKLHPAASDHLPMFITAPGDTDTLMVLMAVILVFAVIGFGVLFLTLHTLPERMAHKSHKLQFEIVAVLGLLALFTHMHIFWVAGLLLALIDFPDFGGWFARIAGSVEKIADGKPGAAESADGRIAVAGHSNEAAPPQSAAGGRGGDGVLAVEVARPSPRS
jgi:hypothetical protein